MQCNACVEICPVGIEQAPIINQLRRRLVEEGELDPNLQSTLEVIHKSGNSFGENKRRAGAGRRSSTSTCPTRASSRSTCSGSSATTPRLTRARSGSRARWPGCCMPPSVDFGILYDGERNSGNDVRRVGEEGLFEIAGRAEHRDDLRLRVRADRDHRPALAQHAAQRVPRPRRRLERGPPHGAAARADRVGPARRRRPAGVPGHLPRPLSPRALQGRIRRPAADPRAARLHARRDAAQPRQLVLLRCRRRADLDPG